MTRTKITSAEWPDPTEWVNTLYQAMAERQAIYDAESDALLKRNKAGGMLGLVVLSLLELPAFRNDSVHLPLKDLMIFLSDLDRGRDHPWSAPVNFGGTSITNTAQSELKVWVRAAYGVLRENGFRPVEAYRRIANGLTSNGRSGRNGRPVRWQKVQTWCLEAEALRDEQVKDTVQRWWTDFRANTAAINIVDDWSQPVAEREVAGRFADLCWSLPHLRDRSVSGGSE
ncbi:MAG: hypothetical protein C0429_15225 [Sphingopyxis sp.]|nr:hypothetical protein [Sphingopyxis sp.]